MSSNRASVLRFQKGLPLLLVVGGLLFIGPPAVPFEPADLPPFAPGEILIKFKSAAPRIERESLLSRFAAEPRRRFRSGAEHWRLPPGLDVEQMIAAHRGDPGIEYIEPNYLLSIDRTPNDEIYSSLWGLNNTGQLGGTPGADVSAESAWNVSVGSRHVVVAVVDTGIDYRHPDLAPNIFLNEGEIPENGMDDDGNGYVDDVRGWDFANDDNDPFDDVDHGTHVAGTIGAVGNNGIGVVGVNWEVSLMPLKFLRANGTGLTSDAIEAIDYATLMGVDVINASWGGAGFSEALQEAISAAGSIDIIFVAAAGNSSVDNDVNPHYPSAYSLPNIISVAATTDGDLVAGFSNLGRTTVDLGAPGSSIVSTIPDGRYGTKSGTSMAAPHVAGVIALMRAVAPGIGVAEATTLLLDSVDPIAALDGVTVSGGRLNAFLPIAIPDDIAPGAIDDLAIEAAATNSVRLRWTATGDDAVSGTATTYDLRYASFPLDAASFELAVAVPEPPKPAPAGTTERFEVTGLEPETTYYFAIRAVDEWSNRGPVGSSLPVTTLSTPTFASSPGSFSADLFTGQRATRTLTIRNAGEGSLDWSIPLLLPASASPGVALDEMELAKGSSDPRSGHPVLDGFGGPDRFGYRFIDSDEPGGPAFVWEDIAESGTPVAGLTGDDQSADPVPLGFDFPFYGASFSSVRISTNGFLSFTSPSSAFTNQPLPGRTAPANLVAPYWDDLHFGGDMRATYLGDGERFTVQYTGVAPVIGPGAQTFQVTLFRSGEIRFQYLSMTADTSSATIGIQDGERERGLQMVFNAAYVHDNLAVSLTRAPEWLSAAPASGRLFGGDSQEVVVSIDAGGLEGGLYEDSVSVQTNDPASRLVEHPVSLRVTGAPSIEFEPDRLDFGTVFLGRAMTLPLSVRNDGTETLRVESISSGHAAISSSRMTLEIPPRSVEMIEVTYSPASSEILDTVLTFESNASNGATTMVQVIGAAAPPPALNVAPSRFDETIFAGDRFERDLIISNTGGSDLLVTLDARVQAGDLPGADDWLDISPMEQTIPPGSSATFGVSFDAADLIAGVLQGDIVIHSNIPTLPLLRVPAALTVIGVPNLVLEGMVVRPEMARTYSGVGAQTVHDIPLPFQPSGEAVLEVDLLGDFGNSVELATVTVEGLTLGTVGGVGLDCAPASGRFTIGADDFAAVAADGVISVEIQNGPAVDPICPVNRHTARIVYSGPTDRIDFGPVFSGLNRTLTLTLRNNGSEILNITGIGSDHPWFSASTAGLVLPPRTSESVSIRFAPELEDLAEGRLRIHSDDPDTPMVEVALTGSGRRAPVFRAAPPGVQVAAPSGTITTAELRLTNMEDEPVDFVVDVRGRSIDPDLPGACAPREALVAEFDGRSLSRVDLLSGEVTSIAGDLFGPRTVVLDPFERTLYTVLYSGQLLSIDRHTGEVAVIRLGLNGPYGLALDAAGTTAYVTELGGGSLVRITLNTGAMARITGGLDGPRAVALSANGRNAYVIESATGELSSVDLESGTILRIATGLDKVEGIAVNRSESAAYYVTFPGEVGRVDLGTGVTARITGGLKQGWGISLDRSESFAWVTEPLGGRLSMVDLQTGEITPMVSGMNRPYGLVLPSPESCVNRFLTVEPRTGRIAAGGSFPLQMRLDAGRLPGGPHAAEVVAGTSGPVVPVVSVPVTLEVQPVPDIAVRGRLIGLESLLIYDRPGGRTDHRLVVTIPPIGGGTLELIANGDYGETGEAATMSVEGVLIGSVGASGNDCSEIARTIALDEATLAGLTEDGVVDVRVQNTINVGTFCVINSHTVRLIYPNADPESGIDFEARFVGLRSTVDVEVHNLGTALLEITAIEVDAPFSVSRNAVNIEPEGSVLITLSFAPVAPGDVFRRLEFVSNDPDTPRLGVDLRGVGLAPPALAVAPGGFAVILGEGDEVRHSLTLRNEGGNRLDYALRISGAPPRNAPDGLCDHPAAIVTEANGGGVIRLDLDTGSIERLAEGLRTPRGIVLDRLATVAYVANLAAGTVSSVDLRSGSVSTLSAEFAAPIDLDIDDLRRMIYVVETNGVIRSVDLDTGETRRVAEGLGFPQSLALDPSGTIAYVTEAAVRRGIAVVDLTSGVVSRLPTRLSIPVGLAVDRLADNAYVVESGPGRLTRVNLVTGSVHRVASGLNRPRGVVLDAAGETAYVSDQDGSVAAFDLLTGDRSEVATSLLALHGVALVQPAFGCRGEFVTVEPRAGMIPPGMEEAAEVVFRSGDLPPGDYQAEILVFSSDPRAPRLIVPAALTIAGDLDDDGVLDPLDNCPGIANGDQADTNHDGSGDACQPSIVLTGVVQDAGVRLEVRALARDPQAEPLSGSIEWFANGGLPVLSIPFVSGLPRLSPISGLDPGSTYRLVITVTDGNTVPVAVEATVFYQGESELLINNLPEVIINAPEVVECGGPDGTAVILDGSATRDIDSTPGTVDDIVLYEWLEDPGRPAERTLGTGAVLSLTLRYGIHSIGLRVTDTQGEATLLSDTVEVADTIPPMVAITPAPAILWPPNHEMVPVVIGWQLTDICDVAPAITLIAAASSEPDDTPGGGDGSTQQDIDGIEPDTADGVVLLRAERLAGGPGRSYTLRYRAVDQAGNVTDAVGTVVVPHDRGEGD